jgi:hypothetical protein
MPSVYEYATSEASNSTTGGWNTAEGMDPSAVNDGMRVHKQNVSGYLKDQGAVNTVGGSANAITVTLAAAPVALVDGYRFTFNATAANTGNTTLNVTPAGGSAFGAKKVLRWEAGSAIELPASSIPAANALTEVIYDSARDSGNGAFMLLISARTTNSRVILEEQQAQNTAGGTFTSGADRTRVLNTEVYDAGNLCTLSSNQFTLIAGTYAIAWSAPAFRTREHQSFLYNVTDSSVVQRGTSEWSDPTADYATVRSSGCSIVTIASPKAFEIRHRANTTAATFGLGVPANFGTELYTRVEIEKLA